MSSSTRRRRTHLIYPSRSNSQINSNTISSSNSQSNSNLNRPKNLVAKSRQPILIKNLIKNDEELLKNYHQICPSILNFYQKSKPTTNQASFLGLAHQNGFKIKFSQKNLNSNFNHQINQFNQINQNHLDEKSFKNYHHLEFNQPLLTLEFSTKINRQPNQEIKRLKRPAPNLEPRSTLSHQLKNLNQKTRLSLSNLNSIKNINQDRKSPKKSSPRFFKSSLSLKSNHDSLLNNFSFNSSKIWNPLEFSPHSTSSQEPMLFKMSPLSCDNQIDHKLQFQTKSITFKNLQNPSGLDEFHQGLEEDEELLSNTSIEPIDIPGCSHLITHSDHQKTKNNSHPYHHYL